jgi:hypothetical protein
MLLNKSLQQIITKKKKREKKRKKEIKVYLPETKAFFISGTGKSSLSGGETFAYNNSQERRGIEEQQHLLLLSYVQSCETSTVMPVVLCVEERGNFLELKKSPLLLLVLP